MDARSVGGSQDGAGPGGGRHLGELFRPWRHDAAVWRLQAIRTGSRQMPGKSDLLHADQVGVDSFGLTARQDAAARQPRRPIAKGPSAVAYLPELLRRCRQAKFRYALAQQVVEFEHATF